MYSVVIPAAGMGSRMNLGFNKLFVKQKGETLIEKTVSLFLNDIQFTQIVLVCSDEDMGEMKQLFGDKVSYVLGGDTRQASVYQGLMVVTNEYVFIHDGARPYISPDLMNRLKESIAIHQAVLPVVDVKDTVKEVRNGVVVNTPSRDTLKLAQTPQVFLTKSIQSAHQQAIQDHFIGTDDAQLYEKYSGDVFIVEGSYQNIKITTPEDLNVSR